MRALLPALAIAFWISGAAAQQPALGAADGTLFLDDKPTPLVRVYARIVRQLPELALDPEALERLEILLTDREIDAVAQRSDSRRSILATAGGLRAVELEIDLPLNRVHLGRLLLPKDERPYMFSALEGETPQFALEDFTLADGRVEGRVRTLVPQTFGGVDESDPPPHNFAFDGRFHAAVMPAEAVTAVLEGEAARKSEPGKLAVDFDRALRAKDTNRLRRLVATDDPAMAMLGTPEGRRIIDFLAENAMSAKGRRAAITKIVFYGDRAVVLSKRTDGWEGMSVIKQGKVWRAGTP